MHASIGTFGLPHGLGLILTRADEVATEAAAGEGRGGGSVPSHSRDQAGAQARTGFTPGPECSAGPGRSLKWCGRPPGGRKDRAGDTSSSNFVAIGDP